VALVFLRQALRGVVLERLGFAQLDAHFVSRLVNFANARGHDGFRRGILYCIDQRMHTATDNASNACD
jgi:hypothetical protein